MREIKFRAWSEPLKKMDYSPLNAISFDGKQIFFGNGEITGFFDSIMQFTGLKDKNGREIFEGDILYHPVQGKRKVYYPFDDRSACYGLEMVGVDIAMRSTLDNGFLYEIIGNLHENPELLEGDSN